jgi:hypothetical protein
MSASAVIITFFVVVILFYGSAVLTRYLQTKDKSGVKLMDYFNLWKMGPASVTVSASCPTAAPVAATVCPPAPVCPPASPPGTGVSLEELQASSDFLKSLNDILQTTMPSPSTYMIEGYVSGDRIGIKTATVDNTSKIIIDGINNVIDLNKTSACSIPNLKPEMLTKSLAVFNPMPCTQLLAKINTARVEATGKAGIMDIERNNINAITDLMTQVIRETCKPDDMITKDKLVTLYTKMYDSICK